MAMEEINVPVSQSPVSSPKWNKIIELTEEEREEKRKRIFEGQTICLSSALEELQIELTEKRTATIAAMDIVKEVRETRKVLIRLGDENADYIGASEIYYIDYAKYGEFEVEKHKSLDGSYHLENNEKKLTTTDWLKSEIERVSAEYGYRLFINISATDPEHIQKSVYLDGLGYFKRFDISTLGAIYYPKNLPDERGFENVLESLHMAYSVIDIVDVTTAPEARFPKLLETAYNRLLETGWIPNTKRFKLELEGEKSCKSYKCITPLFRLMKVFANFEDADLETAIFILNPEDYIIKHPEFADAASTTAR